MKTITRGLGGKVRIRLKRHWRGYRAGQEITPPAALRDELLRAKDPLGNPVAEAVEEPKAPEAEAPAEAPAEDKAPEKSTEGEPGFFSGKGRRKRK